MRRQHQLLLSSLILLFGAGQSWAQSPSPSSPEPPDPQSVVQETLVVTATLEAERADKLPASVEVIDAAEIEARQATSIAELLATATGIHVVRSGSAGKVTSVFSRGTESDHTLVLWNGVELNNPYFGGFDWAFLPTEGVDRIEIVRGPFSALHGSDALGGTIQILRRRQTGGAIRLEAGARGYERGALSLGAEFGNARLDLAGNFRSGDGLESNDFYRGAELVASLEWSVSPTATLGLLTRFNDSAVGIPRSSGLASPERRIDWSERQVAVPFRWQTGNWEFDTQFSNLTLDSSFRDPQDVFGFTESDTRSSADRLRSLATYRFESGSWVAFGAEVERLEVSDRSVFGVNLDRARQETRSVFGQALETFGAVTVDIGARLDDSDVYGSRLTPRVGVLLPIGNSVRLRASYGEGFRAPSLGELFFQFSGNAELEPEESESLELGAQVEVGKWQLELVGFDNRLTNLIDFDFSTFSNINIGRARTRGLEATAGFEGDRLAIRGSASWLDTEDEATGLPLLRRPDRKASMVLTRRQKNTALTVTVLYVGSRADVDPITFARAVNESWARLDLAGEWRGHDRWRPYARLENAFDESYEEALGFPAAPRSLVGGVLIRWQ
ncbi:MAG: TonB-dependent receptor [Acidobacteria bacterium]|nr:TonB-dependent receptor [Acidobacteriota bacterium]